jgi:hypothetical protein
MKSGHLATAQLAVEVEGLKVKFGIITKKPCQFGTLCLVATCIRLLFKDCIGTTQAVWTKQNASTLNYSVRQFLTMQITSKRVC